jgi:hypothetical protein
VVIVYCAQKVRKRVAKRLREKMVARPMEEFIPPDDFVLWLEA